MGIRENRMLGGHNSATYYLDRDKPFAQNAPEFAVELAKWAPRVVRDITYNFGRCQTKNVTEQLHEGIRYFDFRVMPGITGATQYSRSRHYVWLELSCQFGYSALIAVCVTLCLCV